MDYIKRQDENLKEYQYRLYKNQKLYRLTNSEVGDILNKETGNNWDESAYRKPTRERIKAYDEGYEDGFNDANNGKSHEISTELDKKKDELYKQEVRTRDKLREMRKVLRDDGRLENLENMFIECAEVVSQSHPFEINAIPKNTGDRVAILQLSDWHMGEAVDNFMNTYNKDIFKARISKMTTDIIEYCKLMNVSTLKILNLGDLISGNIHVSTRVANEEDNIEQIFCVTEALAKMLTELAKEVENIEFHSVLDNHSRVNKNKKEHIEKESFARFIPWYLKPRLKNVRNIKIMDNEINGVIEYDIGVVNIFHEKALFSHGHNDKIKSIVQDLALLTRIFPIAVFTGHLHRNYEDEVHGIDLIMNPSAIGTGHYAKDIRKSSKPRQKMTIFENNDGKVERIATFILNL